MDYRLPSKILSLPKIPKIRANDISENKKFNSVISEFSTNYSYLIDNSFVLNNNYPYLYEYVYYFTPEWEAITSSHSYETPSNHNYENVIITQMDSGHYVYILSKSNALDFYRGGDLYDKDDFSNLSLVKSFTKINNNYKLENIDVIKLNNNTLFIYDGKYKNIIKINIGKIIKTNNDNDLIVNKILKISGVLDFSIFEDKIYVLLNNKVKIYDLNLNYIEEFDLSVTYNGSDILNSTKIEANENYIYVSFNGQIMLYSNENEYIRSFTPNTINSGEYIRYINNSSIVPDYFYILTTKYLYVFSKDLELYGYFNLNVTNTKDLVSFAIKKNTSDEEIFILDQNKLHYTKNKLRLISLIDEVNVLDARENDDITIKDTELEQDFVYNTALENMIFNNLLLYNSIIYSAIYTTDTNGILNYSHLLNVNNSRVFDKNEFFYGQNEIHGYSIFNRAFDKVLSLQTLIKNNLKANEIEDGFNSLSI